MKLHIENLAKIGMADIKLDGITVIVGDNNTGKSTIGKALWAMYDIFFSSASKAMVLRYLYIKQYIALAINTFSVTQNNKQLQDIIDDIIIEKKTFAELKDFLIKNYQLDEAKVDWENLEEKIKFALIITDEDLLKQVVRTTLDAIFNSQFLSYYKIRKDLLIRLSINGKEISFKISNNNVIEIINNYNLLNIAYIIDNPSQLVFLENYQINSILQLGNGLTTYKFCQSVINNFTSQKNRTENIVEELLIRRNFEKIENLITNILNGTIEYNDKQGMHFISNDFPKYPLHLSNLSQGIKVFALLQTAFKYGTIKEGDIIILDEPEIHLHPDWQIKYAELVVLLQKAFNLTVLLTTHSPEFAQAIHLYSQIHGLSGELNAYISEELEDGTVTMKEVPQEDWDDLFEKFANSFDTLMALRSDLENPDSDSEDSKSETEGQ